MKRFTAILVAQFVVIFAAAILGSWAYSHWRGTPAAPPPVSSEISWFQSELGVDPSQAAKLAALDQEFQTEQSKLCEQHCAKRVELAELIRQSDSMTPQVDALARAMSDLEAKSQRLTIDHIFAVGKQLNATQREKFVTKVYNQMCSSCPMGMHKPAPGKQASTSCGSSGCTCCVTSRDHKSVPAQPVAQLTPSQPRLDLFTPRTEMAFPSAGLVPCTDLEGSLTSAPHSSSLCVLYSVFRI